MIQLTVDFVFFNKKTKYAVLVKDLGAGGGGAGPCCSVPFKTLLFAIVSSVIPNLLPAFPLCAPYSNTPPPTSTPPKGII